MTHADSDDMPPYSRGLAAEHCSASFRHAQGRSIRLIGACSVKADRVLGPGSSQGRGAAPVEAAEGELVVLHVRVVAGSKLVLALVVVLETEGALEEARDEQVPVLVLHAPRLYRVVLQRVALSPNTSAAISVISKATGCRARLAPGLSHDDPHFEGNLACMLESGDHRTAMATVLQDGLACRLPLHIGQPK